MPRTVDGIYSLVPGAYGVLGEVISLGRYNAQLADFAADLNAPRPVSAGGTGQVTATLPETWTIHRQGEPTARMRFSVAAIPSGETRTVFMPNSDVTLFNAIGAVFDFAGSVAPLGFLMCYGQAVSRSTYSDLWTVIGATYGAGDGSTTFNVPDLRGRVVAGKDDMGSAAAGRLTAPVDGSALGAAGGAQSHTLTEAQIAAHSHGASSGSAGAHTHSGSTAAAGAHGHTLGWASAGGSPFTGFRSGGQSGPIDSSNTASVYSVGDHTHGLSIGSAGAHTHTVTVNSAGGGQAHPNVQPTAILNKIIFAGA